MIDLYRRNIWRDTKTVNVITSACFSKVTKVSIDIRFYFINEFIKGVQLNFRGPGWLNELGSWITTVHTRLYKLQKGCTRLAAASDKVYQLLAHPWSVVLSGYSSFFHH